MSNTSEVALRRYILSFADARRDLDHRTPRPIPREKLVEAAAHFAAINNLAVDVERVVRVLVEQRHLCETRLQGLAITTAGEVARLRYKKGAAY